MRASQISIVMVCSQKEEFCCQAINSVLGQVFDDWRLIIFKNGVAPGDHAFLRRFAKRDRRIRVLGAEKPLSIPAARNRALSAADGEFIAVLDDDDEWLPTRLSRQLGLFEELGNEDVGVCGSFAHLIDSEGGSLGTKEFPVSSTACYRSLKFRNPLCHSATLIRRECFKRFGNYDERLHYAHDLELWFRFSQAYRLVNIPEYLVKYRVTGSNVTLTRQSEVIDFSIRARRTAVEEYGYPAGAALYLSCLAARAMKCLPPRLVFYLFTKPFLRLAGALWKR